MGHAYIGSSHLLDRLHIISSKSTLRVCFEIRSYRWDSAAPRGHARMKETSPGSDAFVFPAGQSYCYSTATRRSTPGHSMTACIIEPIASFSQSLKLEGTELGHRMPSLCSPPRSREKSSLLLSLSLRSVWLSDNDRIRYKHGFQKSPISIIASLLWNTSRPAYLSKAHAGNPAQYHDLHLAYHDIQLGTSHSGYTKYGFP